MNTTECIAVAEKHMDNDSTMASSAQSCVEDAKRLAAQGEERFAREWALRSLDYSVGVFHKDRKAVCDALLCPTDVMGRPWSW